MNRAEAIKVMHDRCAVYTASGTAARLLDLIGWTAEADLSSAILLEPCAGEGAILLEAVDRLIASFRQHGRPITKKNLLPRIQAFEFHEPVAAEARRAIRLKLIQEGVNYATGDLLVNAWVRNADFLLQSPRSVTHIAANPPYLRWSKLPPLLAAEYRTHLRPISTRGDVAVAFLDRMLDWAGETGRISALVSDRWMFAQYGAHFIAELKKKSWALTVIDEQPVRPFIRQVGVSSAIVRLSRKGEGDISNEVSRRRTARLALARLALEHGTLAEAGCIVKVGPALGSGNTFIVSDTEAATIEAELVRPYVSRRQLDGKVIDAGDSKVVVPYDLKGRPIDAEIWPGFLTWANQHKDVLKTRSHVKGSERWWRTIDAIGPQWDQSPKLLLAEMCNEAVTTIDRSGGIPAHSLYAIWPGEWPIEPLQRVLNAGLLHLTADAEAPRLKGNWYRFYKRFIVRTPLPKWSRLSPSDQSNLTGDNHINFATTFRKLFHFEPQ